MTSEINKELQDISPFVCDLRDKLSPLPYKVPENYFEQLADNIIEKSKEYIIVSEIAPDNKSIVPTSFDKKINLLTKLHHPLRTVAATFLLVAGSWWAFNIFSTKNHSNGLVETAQVKRSVLNSFITENIEDYDETTLLENGILTKEDFRLPTMNLDDNKNNPELKKYLHDNFDTPDDEDL